MEKRILIVDDEEINIELFLRILEILGFNCVGAKSGAEALSVFSRNPESFNLIITDLTMPEMTGEEFSQKILELRPSMRIIWHTGDHLKKKPPEIRGILKKPASINEISRIVSEVLSSP